MKSSLIMLGATIIAILLVSNFFNDPGYRSPEEQIAFSKLVLRPHLANEALITLVKKDSGNVNLHYQLIRNIHETWDEAHDKLINSSDIPDLEAQYKRLASSSSLHMQDIGNFGLGAKSYMSEDYGNTLTYLHLIQDSTLPDVNLILGNLAKKQGKWQEAENRFKKEIAINGNINEARHALALMYYYDNDWTKYSKIASLPGSYKYLSGTPLQEYFFRTGSWLSYYGLIIYEMFHGVNLLALLAAVIIALIWIIYLQKIDVFESEKWIHILFALILGMLFSFLTDPIVDSEKYLTSTPFINDHFDNIFYCIANIGLVEELVKILPFLLILRFTKYINEPIDYIIYASVCALGFSLVENTEYFKTGNIDTIMLRSLLSTTMHMFMSSLIAYGLILSKYRNSYNIYIAFLLYYVMAAIIHGTFDFLLMQGAAIFTIVYVGIPSVFIWGFIINNALNQSSSNESDHQIDEAKLVSFLSYSFAGIFIFVFLTEGYWFGPTITFQNVSDGALFCIPFLAIVSMRLTSYNIIPTYWASVQYGGFTLFKSGYKLAGRRIQLEALRESSMLANFGTIKGTVTKDMDIEDIQCHVLNLDQPLNIDDSIINQVIIGPKDDDEPAGLADDVICYFMLIPIGLNLESDELTKKDFEFIDWVNVNPLKNGKKNNPISQAQLADPSPEQS